MVCLWFWGIYGTFFSPSTISKWLHTDNEFSRRKCYQGWCGFFVCLFCFSLFDSFICIGLYSFPFSPIVHILKNHPFKLNIIGCGTKLIGVQEAFEQHIQMKILNLGDPVRSQELGLMIFVVSLQLRILNESMKKKPHATGKLRWWLPVLVCQGMVWFLQTKWIGIISAVPDVYGLGTRVQVLLYCSLGDKWIFSDSFRFLLTTNATAVAWLNKGKTVGETGQLLWFPSPPSLQLPVRVINQD